MQDTHILLLDTIEMGAGDDGDCDWLPQRYVGHTHTIPNLITRHQDYNTGSVFMQYNLPI